MPTAQRFRELNGERVALELTPAGGGGSLTGRIVGTLEAADGLVVVVEREGDSRRVSVNYQHVADVQAL